MKILKRLTILVLLVSVFMFFVSCQKTGGIGSSAKGGPVAEVEAHMMEELEKPLPDFTCPPVEDPNVTVEGMPEDVVWLTSHPKDLSSKYTKVGGTIHYSIGEYPTTFRYVGPEANISTRGLMWSAMSLVEFSPETQEIFPAAATHWAFGADKQTIYFKLHEGVKWSDGTPCTADDYLFQWECMTSPNLNDPWYNDYYANLEVKKINDYCISIKYLLSNDLDSLTLMYQVDMNPKPKHFYNGELKEGWYEEYNWKIEPTTGPYVMNVDENVQGELLVFERQENWWARSYPHYKNTANIKRLEYKVISGGADIQENYFWKGELDTYALNIPEKWRKAADNENITKGYIDRWIANFQVKQGLSGFFLNPQYYFFSDKRVRQAMYYALNVQGMIDQALYGEYKRYHNISIGQIWAGVNFSDNTIRVPDFNPDKAKELLAEAGYDKVGNDGILVNDKGQRASFELLYGAAHHTERLSVLKEEAKKAGVEVNLKLMESGMFQTCLNRKHQAASILYNSPSIPSYWQFFAKVNAEQMGNNNTWAWWSPEMEPLLDKEQAGLPLQERAEISKKIQRIVHDEALIIPDYYLDFRRVAAWKWVRLPVWGNRRLNVDADFFNEYSYMWVDEDIKEEVLKAMQEGKTFEPRVWKLSERYISE